jgi:hypothetical protein
MKRFMFTSCKIVLAYINFGFRVLRILLKYTKRILLTIIAHTRASLVSMKHN